MFVSLTSNAQSLEPGIWKTKTSFNIGGIPLPPKDHEDCVLAEQAKDAKSTIIKALKKEGCEVTHWEIKKNELEAGLSCKNNDVQASGKIHGKFSAKNYSLKGEADGTYKNMIPSKATLEVNGQWIKKCKK